MNKCDVCENSAHFIEIKSQNHYCDKCVLSMYGVDYE